MWGHTRRPNQNRFLIPWEQAMREIEELMVAKVNAEHL
jgi:hypothetical protein